MGFWMIAIWVALTVIQYLIAKALAPKIAKRGPGELQAPVCEQGYPIPVSYGLVKSKGSNVVWSKGNSAGKGPQYDYYCDMQLAICHGTVDRIRRTFIGESVASAVLSRQESGVVNNNPTGVAVAVGFTNNPPSASLVPVGTVYIVGSNPTSIWWPGDSDYPFRNNWDAPNPNPNLYPDPAVTPPPMNQPFPPPGWLIKSGTGVQVPNSWRWYEPSGTISIDGQSYQWNGTAWVPVVPGDGAARWVVGIATKESGIEIQGGMTFYRGRPNQAADTTLMTLQDRPVGERPAFGGLCYAVLGPGNRRSKFWWGHSNVLPEMGFEYERCVNPLGLYFTEYAIDIGDLGKTMGQDRPDGRLDTHGYAANPANILYDLMTSTAYGLGIPASNIDVASFRDAGRILAYEQFGMSLHLDQQSQFDDVAGDILKTVDGVLFSDTANGLWVFRLIRERFTTEAATSLGLETNFYTRTDWIEITEDEMIGAPEYSRGSLGDVANEIKVQYIDPKEGYAQRVVQVQDLANYMTQGSVVSVSNVYNGVNTRSLAIRLAYRDLRSVGSPRARVKVRLNQKAWSLRPGDCFEFNYPTLGVIGMVMRVATIQYGTLADAQIEVEAIEDVFSMPNTVYEEPGSGWVDPTKVLPVAPLAVRAWEIPHDVTGDGPKVTHAVLVVRGDEYTTGARLWASIDNGAIREVGEIGYTPSAVLTAALPIEERTASFLIQGGVDLEDFVPDANTGSGQNLLLVDDEVIAFQSLQNNGDGTWSVIGAWRGVLDTVPKLHALGSRVWIIRDPGVVQQVANTDDHLEGITVQAYNAAGELDHHTQPYYQVQTNSRALRPTVPGKFRLGSATTLEDSVVGRQVTGDLAIAWKTRNRLTQAPGVVPQDADSRIVEFGQQTRVIFKRRPKDVWPMVKLDGTAWPMGTTVDLGPVASAGNWARVLGGEYPSSIGVGTYVDELLPWLGIGTFFVAFNFGYPAGLSSPGGDYNLYQVVLSTSGGNAFANVTDLRPANDDTYNIQFHPGQLEGSTYLASNWPDHAVWPARIAVDAEDASNISVPDRPKSYAQHESGLLYPAGYGQAYGMFYGGE